MASIRQPIVSVLGHVDHGKTTLLDRIRGTGVAGREAGGITQHIGATEVPLAAILEMCGDLVKGRSFRIPGLLFIDTPGHVAFSTLRARGGALADLAVLVIDVNEGFRPQTIESLNILRRYKTPFVVAANKIDMVPGWRKHEGQPFVRSYQDQPDSAREELDRRMYELVGRLFEHGFSADRYDRIEDFTTNLAVIPVSAKFGEGVPDLLLTLIGLAQRFLEEQLATAKGPAVGTILEVKEEKGLGITLDAITFEGTLSKGDTIVFGTAGKPGTTKVKALLKPKPLDEIRDPQERFDSVKSVSAAAGVKIVGSGLEKAVAGAPIRTAKVNVAAVIEEVAKESQVHIETQDEGILVKADAIGSLEGLAYECKQASISIKFARLGPVSRRDVTDAATAKNPLTRAILAFNLEILPDAKTALREHPDLEAGDLWSPRPGRSDPSGGIDHASGWPASRTNQDNPERGENPRRREPRTGSRDLGGRHHDRAADQRRRRPVRGPPGSGCARAPGADGLDPRRALGARRDLHNQTQGGPFLGDVNPLFRVHDASGKYPLPLGARHVRPHLRKIRDPAAFPRLGRFLARTLGRRLGDLGRGRIERLHVRSRPPWNHGPRRDHRRSSDLPPVPGPSLPSHPHERGRDPLRRGGRDHDHRGPRAPGDPRPRRGTPWLRRRRGLNESAPHRASLGGR